VYPFFKTQLFDYINLSVLFELKFIVIPELGAPLSGDSVFDFIEIFNSWIPAFAGMTKLH